MVFTSKDLYVSLAIDSSTFLFPDCNSPLYCHHGGTCNLINGGKGHTCSCADGWKGSNCDLVGKADLYKIHYTLAKIVTYLSLFYLLKIDLIGTLI
jgi:hypothetical protein